MIYVGAAVEQRNSDEKTNENPKNPGFAHNLGNL
jgi:hypothetical protein